MIKALILGWTVFFALLWVFPELVGKWLYQVDEARYENVIDQ